MTDKELYEMEFEKDGESESETPATIKTRALQYLSMFLTGEREKAIADKRRLVEPRLIESARLYEGQKDANQQDLLPAETAEKFLGSRAYVNITRQLTNDGASQLGDILFPSDDKNYGLRAVELTKPPLAIQNEPAVNKKNEPIKGPDGQPVTNMQDHTARVAAVNVKVKRMLSKLDTAFSRSDYAKKGRLAIRDSALYGTGILKGPITTKGEQVWNKRNNGNYGLREIEALKPDMKVVSPFDFYPDMSASTIEECVYVWERSYVKPSVLQKAPKELGFDEQVVREALRQGVTSYSSEWDTGRQGVTENSTLATDGRLVVWERRGYVESEKLREAGIRPPEDDFYSDVIVHFVGDKIARIALNPAEKDDIIYSTFVWDEDPLSIFGYGIPTLMKDPQATYVSVWRMATDNAGLSAVPQVIIDKAGISPATGNDYVLRPGKTWNKTGEKYSHERQDKPFEIVHITQNIQQLFALLDKAEEVAYALTGVTRVDKSQQVSDNAPVTLGATQIQQNNSSVSRRAQARRYDDMITSTLVRRFYEFFMQFEADADIKAAMVVEPRGSTILLSKELQSTNLMQFYQITQGGQADGIKTLELLRAISSSMQFSEGKFIETDDEMQARAEAEQEQGQEPTPEQKLQEREVAVKEAQVELDQASLQLKGEEVASNLRLKEAIATTEFELKYATLDSKAQESISRNDLEIYKVDTQSRLKAMTSELSESTKRDSVAVKVSAEMQREQNTSTKTAEEIHLRHRENDRLDKELAHKVTTGQTGI